MITLREITDGDLLAAIATLKPADERPVVCVEIVLDDDHLRGLRREGDNVALSNAVRRNIDAATVDEHQTMIDELASLRSSRCPTSAERHVVKAGLKQDEKVLTGWTLKSARLVVRLAELLLKQAIDVLRLLLLLHLGEILRSRVSAAIATVDTWWERAALHRAASLFIFEHVHAKTTRHAYLRAGVAGHLSSSDALVDDNHYAGSA